MSSWPSSISVSSSCVHKFLTGMSLKGVTLSMSPAAVSRAFTSYSLSGHVAVNADTTSSVCFNASLDFRVPTLNLATSAATSFKRGTLEPEAV